MTGPYHAPPPPRVDLSVLAPKADPAFTGVVTLPAGTVAVPGLAFADDADTGLSRPENDAVTLSAGGTGQLRCDPSGIAIGRAGTWLHGSSSDGGQGLLGANAWLDGATVRFGVDHGSIAASGLMVNWPQWNAMALFCNAGGAAAGQAFTPNAMVVAYPAAVAVGGVLGGESLRVGKVDNAVNRVLVEGGAPGIAPSLSASGSDADIHLRLQPKGGGTVIVPALPTSAAGLPAGALWNDGGTLKVA